MTIPFASDRDHGVPRQPGEPTARACDLCGHDVHKDLLPVRRDGHGFVWACVEETWCEFRRVAVDRSRAAHPSRQEDTAIRGVINAIGLEIVLVLAIVVLAVAMINAVRS